MGDDDSGSPLIDMARGVYKGANDLINKIPTPGYTSEQDKNQADPGMVQEANKSFLHAAQTAAQKKAAPVKASVKTVIKTGPRKR